MSEIKGISSLSIQLMIVMHILLYVERANKLKPNKKIKKRLLPVIGSRASEMGTEEN